MLILKQKKIAYNINNRSIMDLYLCTRCGNTKVMLRQNVKRRKGKSCGCAKNKIRHGKTKTYIHKAWINIKSRCTNPKATGYSYYGGRGIKMCERWSNSFEAFYEDMGERPTPKHSIDRINGNGNYEPSNCRWASIQEQADNKKQDIRRIIVSYNGEQILLSDLCDRLHLPYEAIRQRYKYRHWSLERALTTPI